MGHWVNISDGNFNDEYVGKVRTIGTIHARIGLEPQWYIGGYAIILDHLISRAVEEVVQKGGSSPEMAAATAISCLGTPSNCLDYYDGFIRDLPCSRAATSFSWALTR